MVSGHIIEHTPSPRDYLHEHLRVLKPGGWLFLEFPNRYHWRELHTGEYSVEYLPLPIRELVLRFLESRMSPCSKTSRQNYHVIRKTLKPISVSLVARWAIEAVGHPSRIIHYYRPAPGYVRMLLYRL